MNHDPMSDDERKLQRALGADLTSPRRNERAFARAVYDDVKARRERSRVLGLMVVPSAGAAALALILVLAPTKAPVDAGVVAEADGATETEEAAILALAAALDAEDLDDDDVADDDGDTFALVGDDDFLEGGAFGVDPDGLDDAELSSLSALLAMNTPDRR